MRTGIFVLVLAGAGFVTTSVQAVAFTEEQKLELIAAHNKYRAEVDEAGLAWSDSLAERAQAWAEHLANDAHTLSHSHVAGIGENLAMWTSGRASLTQLVDLWGGEKKYFIQAAFPDVSTTGDWRSVGHYTQMIWRDTTEVGCGLATGGGYDYLACEYAPQGNFMGRTVLSSR
jgi:uncharacterized protein YkwD